MNLIRSVMSLFLFILLGLSVAGWVWAADQPSPQAEGARTALALCGVMALGSIWLLWRTKESRAA
jgi:hypothetical protein